MSRVFRYVGIDPGKSGGIAIIKVRDDRIVSTKCFAMPDTEQDLWTFITDWIGKYHNTFALIEKVGGFAGTGHPGSAMFNFGMSYGALRMALMASETPFDEIHPATWQKLFINKKPKEKKTAHKNRLKAKAQQLYPKLKMTLKTCDAVLLAECCRRLKQTGTLHRD